MSYSRYAVYYTPKDPEFSMFGSQWLGWDLERGQPVRHFDIAGLDEVTRAPRKYGFHATLKPPFRLVPDRSLEELSQAVAGLAARVPQARGAGLQVMHLGRFLALCVPGDNTQIARLAGACVTELDQFRVPATDEELERRRSAGLTQAQDALLLRWGYPYVMDEFRFHMTLTGRLPEAEIAHWSSFVTQHLPVLSATFVLDSVTLVGERADGSFEKIERFVLTGQDLAS